MMVVCEGSSIGVSDCTILYCTVLSEFGLLLWMPILEMEALEEALEFMLMRAVQGFCNNTITRIDHNHNVSHKITLLIPTITANV